MGFTRDSSNIYLENSTFRLAYENSLHGFENHWYKIYFYNTVSSVEALPARLIIAVYINSTTTIIEINSFIISTRKTGMKHEPGIIIL